MPQQAIHIARREYRCDAPASPCANRIYAGRPYTQISYAPGERPYASSGTWTYLKACTSCKPLDIVEEELPAPSVCTGVAGEMQCRLSAGHYPATPHQFLEGLF